MQAHSAKATTNNQQEQEPKQATKQQAKQRVEILRPAQSLCFLCIQHALVLRGCGLLLGGALRPPQPPPAPRNLHFISNTRACHEITFLGEPPAAKHLLHQPTKPPGGGWEPSPPFSFRRGGVDPPPGRFGGGREVVHPPPTICGGQNWRNYRRPLFLLDQCFPVTPCQAAGLPFLHQLP